MNLSFISILLLLVFACSGGKISDSMGNKAAGTKSIETMKQIDTVNLLDHRLHNIWALQEMEGEKVSADDFGKEIPVLEIFNEEGRVVGQDGCNRLSGKLSGNKSTLEFGLLMSTRMACPKMEKSTQFLKLVGEQRYDYHFEPRQLVLSQNGKAVLKFRNVD